MEEDDDPLVSKCKDGDEKAFKVLFERYFKPVFYYCLKFTKSKNEAEDNTQDIFIKVFTSLNMYCGGNFRGWLFRIARNHFIDDYRRRSKVSNVPLDEVIEKEESFSLEEKLELKNDIDRLISALEELTEKCREVMYLRFFQGLKYEEISEVLDLPVGSVKTHIHRGREKLIEILINETKK
ncbi:MAG: RNA polymerase sigma factor [bacterium]